jgi:methionyl-tRNA formyltransferase
MPSLRLIFAGSGEFGVPTLRHLIDSKRHEIVQVLTQPDRPAGRGLKLTPTPVAQLAMQHNLPLLRTGNIDEEGDKLPPADVMVVIAFGQKIAPHIVDHPRLGSINLHGSRLPKYRGAAPINWAIINGESITGNSVIRVAAKMDAGAILGMSAVPIGPLDTAGEVHDRLALDGIALIDRVLEQLATGSAPEAPQDDSRATAAPKLKREHARIDWTRPARDIANQIRGMYPWPGCRVEVVDQDQPVARVTLARARAVSSASREGMPGHIIDDGHVATSEGALEILELQPEGKRAMSLSAYRNGHPWEPGMRLESIT